VLQVAQRERGAGDWSNYVPPSATLAAIAARSRAANGSISAALQLHAPPQQLALPSSEPAAGPAPLPALLRERLAARGIATEPQAAPAAAAAAPAAPAAHTAYAAAAAAPPPLPPGWVRAQRSCADAAPATC
jgi:hypothetical protein